MTKKMTMALLTILSLALLVSGCSKDDKTEKTDTPKTETAANDNVAIQAVMTAYVDAKLAGNDSVYSIGDKKGAFDHMHDGVNEMNGMFVSCVDVKVGDDVYDVDLYVMKHDNGSYMVGREVLHQINGKPDGTVLWESDMMSSGTSDSL